jgi:hypothetical protein
MSSSSDDFFNNPLSSPPKLATNKMQNKSQQQRVTRRAPPPPPKPTTAAAASSSSRSSATTNRRRPNAATSKSTTANRSSYKSIRTVPAASTTLIASSTGAAAPAAAAPSSYYASSAPSASNTASNTTSNTAGGFYGSSSTTTAASTTAATTKAAATTAATTAASSNQQYQWDSWAAPAATPAVNQQWQQPSATDWSNPSTTNTTSSSSNALEMSAPGASTITTTVTNSSSTSSNDWYRGGNTAISGSDPPLTQWQTPAPVASTSTTMPSMQGSMDHNSINKSTIMTPSIFQPLHPNTVGDTITPIVEDYEHEPPLLEEIGIHFDHILLKTKAVCWPFQRAEEEEINNNTEMVNAVVQDPDLIGPICYCLLLGGEMVLTGKLQFGYIYGFGLFGCVAMTLIVNLTAPQDAVSFWVVSSVLGYALIPVNILALVKIVVINLASLQTLGRFLGMVTVVWSTTASTRLLEMGCGLREQRYLIAYPIALLYSAFVLITIF